MDICNHMISKAVRYLFMFFPMYYIQYNIIFPYTPFQTNDCYSDLSTKASICK